MHLKSALLIGAAGAGLATTAAHAQSPQPSSPLVQATIVATCGTPPAGYRAGQPMPMTQDTTGKLCTLSSGGGGGGPVTIANGADVALGSTTDAAGGTGTQTAISLFKQIHLDLVSPLPAGTNAIGSITNFPATVDTNTGAAGPSMLRVALATGSTVTASGVSAGAITSFRQTTTASAVALSSNAATNGYCIKAMAANTGTVAVGGTGVLTTTGYPLAASESVCCSAANTNAS